MGFDRIWAYLPRPHHYRDERPRLTEVFFSQSIDRKLIPSNESFSERFGTKIITETIARVDFSQRPFKYWTEGEEEEADFMTADT